MKTYNNKWIKAEEGPENSVIYTDPRWKSVNTLLEGL